MGTARIDLRRAVADELGDLRTFKCTHTSASPGVFIDKDRAVFENGTLAGRDGVAYRGANKGEWRVVRDSSRTDRSFTFWSDFPAVFAVGDELDLYNVQGRGWHKDHYDRAINDVLRDVGEGHRVPMVADLTASFDYAYPYLDVPEDMMFIEGVEYFVPYLTTQTDTIDGDWVSVDNAAYPGGSGWTMLPEGRVVLDGRWRVPMNEKAVRVIGLGVPSLLYNDSDETPVNFAYLKLAVAATLLRGSLWRQVSPERERQLAAIERSMQGLYPRVNTRVSGIRVR